MDSTADHRVDWRALVGRSGFRYVFVAMLVSLFGSGMNYAAVTWYILEKTNSTLNVSLMLILVTLPGLVVPPFGGVLIDRMDRRQLGVILDLARGAVVLGTAALVFRGRAGLWLIYTMTALLGIGFSIYWSTMNALVQEVIHRAEAEDPVQAARGQMAGANTGVLIAVQSGMMAAGAVVGFLYERAGVAGILAIDGATYLGSALCLLALPWKPLPRPVPEPPPTIEAPRGPGPPRPEIREPPVLPAIVEPGIAMAFFADLREGLHYLRAQPRVFALGFTYACMMAGVISAHVLLVVLVRDVLRSGPVGYGYMETGWAVGALAGGFTATAIVQWLQPQRVLQVSLVTLALGHALFPYNPSLVMAVAMNVVFGGCRAYSGVLTQTAIMSTVPQRLMGRTQSAFTVISTLLQVFMSFSLGWLAQRVNLPVAFAVLGMLYGSAALAAFRARALGRG